MGEPAVVTQVTRPDGGTTTVELRGAGYPMVLAPGAGAGSDHPFMTGMRDRLLAAGHAVASFDYPYRAVGRRSPDRPSVLVACHRAVFDHVVVARGAPPILVGKSMGGRIGSHLGVPAPGWVFLGYPLVAAGTTAPRDVSHLHELGPMLFVQGERDALAPRGLIETVVDGLATATMEVIPGADHGFRVPRRLGVEPEEILDRIAEIVIAWVAALPALRLR